MIFQQVGSQNELIEWVESEEKNQIHLVLAALTNAQNYLQTIDRPKEKVGWILG